METYEFRVTVDAEGKPPAELVRQQVDSALLAIGNIPFGDEDEYEVFTWTVDIQDPETSVTYVDRGDEQYVTWEEDDDDSCGHPGH
jgi:hypothetical protein